MLLVGMLAGARDPRAIVDACRPFEWKDEFPPVAESSPELAAKTYEKWKHLLGK